VSKYHKIILNGKVYYREFHEASGLYEDELLSEEELIERYLDDVVESTIEIDQGEIQRIINCIPHSIHRERIQNYIEYMERLVESLE